MIDLKKYPSEWSLTPLSGKNPVRGNWNYEETLSRDTLIEKYPNHNIGLRTGNVSNGILAIDFDGNDGCKKLWDEIKGSNEDLPTVSFKSGKAEGYHQRLYKIPDKYRDIFNGFIRKEYKANVVNPNTGKEEQLEFRYNSCASVLPPSIHPETNKPYIWIYSPEKTDVIDAPTWLLNFIINKWNYQKNEKKVNINTENKGLEISLFKCLSKNTRALIDKGVNEGSRNNTGFKIACEIIGTAKYIESKGLSYKEDLLEIFTQYCENCSPPLDSNEYQHIWESANNDEREPLLSEDYINTCINAQLPSRKSYTFNKPNISANEARKLVENLVEQNLKKSELEAKLNEISKKSSISVYNLKNQYNALLDESDYDLEKVDLKERIDRLISLDKSSNSVDLSKFFPQDLVYNLNHLRPILGSTNLALLSVFMTCFGSRIHPYLYLNLIKDSGFKAKGNNLFTAIVGESGEAKSPTINLFTDPLNKIQAEYNLDYAQALKEYEIEEYKFNNLSKEEKQAVIESGLKPEKPIPKDCIINDSTIEQLLVTLNNQPNEGVLLHFDELSGLINGMNRYKKSGNDREIILGFRDGKAPNVHRKNGTRLTTTKANVGIVGAITTDILMQQMEDGSDPSGHWARFIYAFIPRTKQEFPEEIGLNIDNYLYLLYKRVYDITCSLIGEGSDEIGIDLSSGAKKLYKQYFGHIENERYQEDIQAIRSYLSKSKRLVGELAFILHILYGVYEVKAGNIFPMEVDINTIEKAIELTNIFSNQVRLIHSKLNDKEVSALHKEILDYAKDKDKVTARDLQRNSRLFKNNSNISSDDIRKMFLELEKMNYGTTTGKGARLSFSLNKPNGNNPNGGTNKPTPDTPPLDNNSNDIVITNNHYDTTSDFNIGTGNNYSTNNFESNTQFNEKNNLSRESVDSLDKNESKPSQGNDLSLQTFGRQLTFDFPIEISEKQIEQGLQKMSTVLASWSSVADISPTVSENKTVVIENGEIIIDESKLDLFKKYDTPIPEWQPTKEIKPFESLTQCHLDIETLGLDANEARIIMIGLTLTKNNKTEYTIITNENEAKMLRELNKYLLSNKIDLLIGHNIFNFDIPFLIKRAEINKVPTLFEQAGEKYINNVTSASFYGKPMKVRQCVLKGVDIIDTMVLAAIYDKSKAVLNNYRLKDVAIAIGYRDERRLELSGDEISDHWNKGEIEPIDKYLRFDLEDTKALSDFFLPVYHYQTKVVDMSVQKLVLASPAKIWNTIAESFYSKKYIDSIDADDKLKYQGATTFANPCFAPNAFKIDVSSMYPSIILTYRLKGKKDIDGRLLSVMQYLTNERLKLKKRYFETGKEKYNHQQNAFKVLINGGYGFLGTGGYPFNDMTVAARVTAYGRALMSLMLDKLNELNINIHEVDTDGIICSGGEAEDICNQVQSVLPEGIQIGVDWDKTDVFISGAKNYILYTNDGKIKRVGKFRKRDQYALKKDFIVTYFGLYRTNKKSAEDYYQSVITQLEAGTYHTEDLKITRKIGKAEKKLVDLGIGQVGDKVTYYMGEEVKVSEKTGKQLKSFAKPVTTGSYWSDWYVSELEKMYNEEIKPCI